MFKKIAFFALFLAVTGLFAATSVNAQRLIKGSLVTSTDTSIDTLIEATPEANPSFDPSQCANGGQGAPVQSCGTSGANNWETGNMNGSKAHYAEGTTIHYRYTFTNLTVGTRYTFRIAYDAWQQVNSKHAIDYLKTYDADIDPTPGKVYQVIPCGGAPAPGCVDGPVTFDIPLDGGPGLTPPSQAGGEVFTGWNISDAVGFTPTATFLPYVASSAERMIEVKFTATQVSAVLAWGGHIADSVEWAAVAAGHQGATSIPGSPYHMRNGGTGSFGDGQKELQLATSAVVTQPSAADATITGRVTDPYGRAISSAKLTLINAITGEVETAYTNTFGYYKFDAVPVGDFYVMNVQHRRYLFVNGSVSFSLQDSIAGLNFQASR